MKGKNLLWLIIGLLTVILTAPGSGFTQDDRRFERREQWWERWTGPTGPRGSVRELEGRWYLNGERDKQCEIVETRQGLVARNERGDSTLVDYRGGVLRAAEWRLRGEVRRDRIDWENGTTWTRFPNSRSARR